MAEPGRICADIGADHGQLSAALLLNGKAEHMLVADVSGKSLGKARDMMLRLGLQDKATFAVADGLMALDALEGRWADTVFIMGMGGETLSHILSEGKARLHGAALILGAQTHLSLLRETLCRIGYRIRQEIVVEENRRSYILMGCSPALDGEPAYDQRELLLGPVLLKTLPPLWRPVLEHRAALLTRAIIAMERSVTDQGRARLPASRQELEMIAETLRGYH